MKLFKYVVMLCIFAAGLSVAASYSTSSNSRSSSSSSSSSKSSYSKPSSSYSSSKSSYSSSSYSRPSTSSYGSRPTTSYSSSSVRTSSPSIPVRTQTGYSSSPIRPAVQSPVTRPSTGYQSSNYARSSSSVSSGSGRVYSNPGSSIRYSSYNRPITRTPSWYRPNYNYRFRNSHYNSGYHYYPVMCDPFTGALASMAVGAMVTHMIMDNGVRQPVYADGAGGAYTVVNGQNVMLAQDENGNWVQLDPTQDNSGYTNQTVVQTQPVAVARPVVVRDNRIGAWGWIGIILCLGFVAGFIVFLFKN